jgi:hypothetical protein
MGFMKIWLETVFVRKIFFKMKNNSFKIKNNYFKILKNILI